MSDRPPPYRSLVSPPASSSPDQTGSAASVSVSEGIAAGADQSGQFDTDKKALDADAAWLALAAAWGRAAARAAGAKATPELPSKTAHAPRSYRP